MNSELIQEIMKSKGLNTSKLAELTGISVSTINKIVYGVTTNPTIDNLLAIAEALECSIEELTGKQSKSDSEIDTLREELKNTPGMRTLFSAAKGVSKEDLEVAAEMIKRMKRESGYED